MFHIHEYSLWQDLFGDTFIFDPVTLVLEFDQFFENFTLNNIWTVSARALMLYMSISCDKTFLPCDLDLGIWPWAFLVMRSFYWYQDICPCDLCHLQWFYSDDAVHWKAAQFNIKGTDSLVLFCMGYVQLLKYKHNGITVTVSAIISCLLSFCIIKSWLGNFWTGNRRWNFHSNSLSELYRIKPLLWN